MLSPISRLRPGGGMGYTIPRLAEVPLDGSRNNGVDVRFL